MGEHYSVVENRRNMLLNDRFVMASSLLNPIVICPVVVNGTLGTELNVIILLDQWIQIIKPLSTKHIWHFDNAPNTSESQFERKMRQEHHIISKQCYNVEETTTQFWKRLGRCSSFMCSCKII
eukprot:NODE_742_length_4662_cov_0.166557.p2 type:complete len:123 gc:universal NODE_742_length_4662_cov_0.166557:3952-3584(-)